MGLGVVQASVRPNVRLRTVVSRLLPALDKRMERDDYQGSQRDLVGLEKDQSRGAEQ